MKHCHHPAHRHDHLLGMLFILFALTGCAQSEPVTPSGKPSIPLQLRLYPLDTVIPGKNLSFEAEVRASTPLSEVVLQVRLPPSLPLIDGTNHWQGALVPGVPQRITFSVHIPDKGRYHLNAIAYVPGQDGNISTEAVFIIGDKAPDATTGVDRSPRPAHPTRDGRPVLEYELR